MINAATKVCATFGNPNRRSNAPLMHNAGFAELALNYCYLAFEPEDIGSALGAVRALNFVGVSVSKPFKEAAVEFLDEIDETARTIGAVNIVHNSSGRLIGYNSDWIGAVDALKEKCDIDGHRVAVLGSGGAARAVVYGLLQNGAEVHVFSRSAEKGDRLARDMGATYSGDLADVASVAPEVLVNATSIGSGTEDDVPIPDDVFRSAKTVMDIIVRRGNSALLRRATSLGAQTIGGVRMLVLQGAFTFELFTGEKAPLAVMQQTVENALK